MLMSKETREALNYLMGTFFGNNSEADNLAYCLADSCYPAISEIYHQKFAHFFTGDVMADGVSELMDMLDARPVRLAVAENSNDYEGNLAAIFNDNVDMCSRCRETIIKIIDLAELNDDYEVKIWAEELLMKFMPYYKQARVWDEFAKRYEGDYKSFNIHFAELTTYIQ